jgi:hypothetical protein
MALQHGERRVLQRGEPGRPEQVIKPGAGGQLDLLDHVQQHRLGPAGPAAPARHLAAGGRRDRARAVSRVRPDAGRHARAGLVFSMC